MYVFEIVNMLTIDTPSHLIWIPGHCGIHLNENADLYAREARLDDEILSIKNPPKDAFRSMRHKIMQDCKGKYRDKERSSENRLFYKIHPLVTV